MNEIIASPGTGEDVIDERLVGRIKFPAKWLRRRALDAWLCRVMRISGESMEPTIPDGSAILMDLDSRQPRDRGIFIVQMEDELVARRLTESPEGGWLVRSDNPDKRAWPTRPWPADGRIAGEVRWMGRSFT